MSINFKSAIADLFAPLIGPRPVVQMAALCHRSGPDGEEVLLVTSSRGNWILPKGWPIAGTDAADAALAEAWEEGGVRGFADADPVATLETVKRFDDGSEVPCRLQIHEVAVEAVSDRFPEADRRERAWVAPEKAATMVADPALADFLKTLDD